jgi:hypothetical protein
VISSGDNENYAHPKPAIVGASAFYGREGVDEKENLLPPLVYSTELARSVKLAQAASLRVDVDRDEQTPPKTFYPHHAEVKAKGSNEKYGSMEDTYLSTYLVYGLVNVRTDGQHILCATMEEKGDDFDVVVFQAGRDP